MKRCERMSREELLREIEALSREKDLILMTQKVALRESEDRYRRMLETANEGVWVIDAKGITSFVNVKMAVILGYLPQEMIGRHLFEFMDEPHRELAAAKLAQRRLGEREQFDFPLRGKDGSQVWTQVCTSPIFDHDRRYLGSLAMVSDITARRRAEEALCQSEAQYRAIIQAFDGLIYICSADFRIQFLNDKMKERTGYDATGEYCYRVLHDREDVCPWCVNERVLAGESVRWEVLSPKDNRWYEVSNTPIYNVDGTVSKQALITDITARKRTEAELLKQKRILSQAAKLARLGAWEWDAAQDAVTPSEQWLDLHGAPGDLSLDGVVDLAHPDDRDRLRRAFWEALDGTADLDLEYRIVRRGSGELRYVHALGEVSRDPEGKPLALLGVVQDVTQLFAM